MTENTNNKAKGIEMLESIKARIDAQSSTKKKIAAGVMALAVLASGYYGYNTLSKPKAAEVTPQGMIAATTGQEVSTTFTVVSGRNNPNGLTLVNDDKYPNHHFTAVIDAKAVPMYSDWKSLQGKTITVTGPKSDYNGKPQIKVNKPEQILVK